MNIVDKVTGQVNEMFMWLDYQGINVYNIAYVSPVTLSDMIKDATLNQRYFSTEAGRLTHPHSFGMKRFQLQTSHAVFFVEADKTVDDEDLQLKDIDGFMYSYKEHYINEMMEQTLLKGNA